MALLGRKTEEQKQDEARAKADVQAIRDAAAAEERRKLDEHLKTIPRWEYQVKRVGEDKQKGLLGSQRMEQIFNAEGVWAGSSLRSTRSAQRSSVHGLPADAKVDTVRPPTDRKGTPERPRLHAVECDRPNALEKCACFARPISVPTIGDVHTPFLPYSRRGSGRSSAPSYPPR